MNPNSNDKTYEIVINGTAYVVEDEIVTYEQLVALAYPGSDSQYSVMFHKAIAPNGGTGSLAAGGSVKVKKKGTSFDVTPTTRS